MTFPSPIDDALRPPVGTDPIGGTPVFEFDPLEPAGGLLLKEDGEPLLQENGRLIALEPPIP